MNKNNDDMWTDAANTSGAGGYVPHTTTSGGGLQYIPSSTGSVNYYQTYPDAANTLTYNWDYGYTNRYITVHDYSVFKLTRKEMPDRVFIDGKMMTLGKVGSRAQVAYDGSNKLIIRKNAMSWDAESMMYISLEYKAQIYHFCVNMLEAYDDDTLILNTHKISKVNL